MTIENDFLPFAVGGSANVIPQAAYAANTTLTQGGFVAGIATSAQLNKVWRQSSIMAAVMAQFIVAGTGQPAIDDGTTATLLANFTTAVNAAAKTKVVLTDTGTANAYAAANPVPLTALPTATGFTQTVKIAHLNTGTSTYAPDGLATAPIYSLAGALLQGNELPVNGVATLVSFVDPLLNSGNLCWVLYECVGGAQPVAPATASQHAMQLGQAYSFAGTIAITGNATLTASAFGNILAPNAGSAGGYTLTLPAASGNVNKSICIFNSSTGNITLNAGNFNTSYGAGVTSIILPSNSTVLLECDGTSYNGVGGSAAIGSAIRPQAASGVGQWSAPTITGSGASTNLTLPSGGTWAWLYFVQSLGGGSGISSGGTNILTYNSSGSPAVFAFCWRIA